MVIDTLRNQLSEVICEGGNNIDGHLSLHFKSMLCNTRGQDLIFKLFVNYYIVDLLLISSFSY